VPHARWHAVGVSLGGNAMLKYMGENPGVADWLAAAAAVSVPLDLVACGASLSDGWLGRNLYTRHFLKTMKQKLYDKSKRFPGTIDIFRVNHARTLRDFDDLYPAPMHG